MEKPSGPGVLSLSQSKTASRISDSSKGLSSHAAIVGSMHCGGPGGYGGILFGGWGCGLGYLFTTAGSGLGEYNDEKEVGEFPQMAGKHGGSRVSKDFDEAQVGIENTKLEERSKKSSMRGRRAVGSLKVNVSLVLRGDGPMFRGKERLFGCGGRGGWRQSGNSISRDMSPFVEQLI
ncbi:hypothetical protein HYC85_006881 [Camellia sinensis]|uniref:Uncharacterized protein n=1 Tax=Camellia sinensis TaxID=4442 RepID=A0A7J7HN83_CAMSI|nr:hypothetical protein HYC85_006881 [Camellia sinensis]